MSDKGIEVYGEATAVVAGKLVSSVFRVVWGIIGGFLNGLCLLPFLRGIKKAIKHEYDNIKTE